MSRIIEKNILEKIGNAQTMKRAFTKLRGLEVETSEIASNGDDYKIVEARKEFVIFNDKTGQFLHPYGSNSAYYFLKSEKE